MRGRDITLEDIYMKLEEIERRIEKLEYAHEIQNKQFYPQHTFTIQQKPSVVKIQTQEPSTQQTVKTEPEQQPEEQKKKKQDDQIDITNWRSLLGFE